MEDKEAEGNIKSEGMESADTEEEVEIEENKESMNETEGNNTDTTSDLTDDETSGEWIMVQPRQ